MYGKYCHICGQENIEPEETVWHLVTHFFNDITHFDGKFFSTLKLLIFKPGFLSAEYKMGRRAAYLNPVRMYIFTSFVFFLVFFSLYKIEEGAFDDGKKNSAMEAVLRQDPKFLRKVKLAVDSMDSAEFSLYSRAINKGIPLSKHRFYAILDSSSRNPFPVRFSPLLMISELDSFDASIMNAYLEQMDSSTFRKFTKTVNEGEELSRKEYSQFVDSLGSGKVTIFGREYQSKQQYDSLRKAGLVKEGWVMRKFRNKVFEINEKYGNKSEKLFANLLNILTHNFPQMLFVSLPLFALFLKLIYYRHREYYFVSHGIYSVHLYIFYFIALLLLMLLQELFDYFEWSRISTVAAVLFLLMLLYEYKAMRNFYGQGRGKTIVKFLLAASWRLFVITLLLIVFLFFSLLKV